VLQYVAVCCSVLQCVAGLAKELEAKAKAKGGMLRVAVCCRVLPCVAVRCCALPCVAVCCSVLQCVAVCCLLLQCVAVLAQYGVASSCRLLQIIGLFCRISSLL